MKISGFFSSVNEENIQISFQIWKLICIFGKNTMRYFETIFLEEVMDFLDSLDKKSVRKIIYNIDLAEQTNDPWLFKKLSGEIWEFRTKYSGNQYRLLAFWDKRNNENTIVIATHAFIKKDSKVPKKELEKAEKIREKYLK